MTAHSRAGVPTVADGPGTPPDATLVRLPDGKEIACPNVEEALSLWHELEDGSPLTGLAREVAPGDTVVDVGAHIGLSSLRIADLMAPGARIIACEPAALPHACLHRNLHRHAPGALALGVGLGREPGTRSLHYHPFVSSNSTFYADDRDEEHNRRAYFQNSGADEASCAAISTLQQVRRPVTVEVTTLTELARQHSIDRIGLLKIDVERAELDVLDGVAPALWPRVRRVVVDVHDIEGRASAVGARLKDLGFRVRRGQTPLYAGGSVYTLVATRE
ncbi:FkbM family methyltransferase [Streptomyces cyaneofuscatus]|uniref:FkbM family methyltransferase n=1 Tax=Streptomyces cyaneofuscatus TaxID=66883 RepID=UPI003801CF08